VSCIKQVCEFIDAGQGKPETAHSMGDAKDVNLEKNFFPTTYLFKKIF